MHMQVGAQVGSIMATGLGAAALMKGPFPRVNFFVAGVFVYMGTIVLEAVSMSLCSKARPAVARQRLGGQNVCLCRLRHYSCGHSSVCVSLRADGDVLTVYTVVCLGQQSRGC